jgi:hypothetical protein
MTFSPLDPETSVEKANFLFNRVLPQMKGELVLIFDGLENLPDDKM